MKHELVLSGALRLPLNAVTQRIAVLGVTGSGKSTTGVDFVEELCKAKLPFVVLDPTGVWWGLRSSKDGSGPGYPVTILGGEHGDLPLDPTSGAHVADLVVDHKPSLILDLSGFDSESSLYRFCTDFLRRLYARKSKVRDPLPLFVDEADLIAPEGKPAGLELELLRALINIVRRGRVRGFGVTLISQRVADVNKKVLGQCETLIAMRTSGHRDIEAVEDWAGKYADKKTAAAMIASLPALATGEGFVCSPFWLKMFDRVAFRDCETFDSRRTPEPGGRRHEAKILAPVDLESLRARMSSTIERAQADDPKELRKKIAWQDGRIKEAEAETRGRDGVIVQLQKELAERPAETERVEVPVLRDEDVARIVELFDKAEPLVAACRKVGEELSTAMNVVAHAVRDARELRARSDELVSKSGRRKQESIRSATLDWGPPPGATIVRPVRTQAQTPNKANTPKSAASGLSGPAQRVADAIRWFETIGVDRPAQSAAACVAGYAAGGSSWRNARGELSVGDAVEFDGDLIWLTDSGRLLADEPDEAPTTAALHEKVLGKISGPAQRVLRPLLDAWPKRLGQDVAAAAAGYEPGGSSWRNARGELSVAKLIEWNRDGVKAADILFLDGR